MHFTQGCLALFAESQICEAQGRNFGNIMVRSPAQHLPFLIAVFGASSPLHPIPGKDFY